MTPERPGCYEIRSTDIALLFARKAHENVRLVQAAPGRVYAACPACKRLLNAEEFLNESCREEKVMTWRERIVEAKEPGGVPLKRELT
jgi:hypothetical protein